MVLLLLIVAVVGYILGSLPFGYLVARAKGVNIFEVGSKNPGATNVRRVLGSGPGNLVLALDALKGALAVAFACVRLSIGSNHVFFSWSLVDTAGPATELLPPLVGLVAALLGHSFSCFTGFKGGKGVATGAGGFVVLFPFGMLIAFLLWGATVLTTRYVSLGSMLGAISLPVTAVIMQRSAVLVVVAAVIAVFVIFRHRANVSRLRAGTESKMGRKPTATLPTATPKS